MCCCGCDCCFGLRTAGQINDGIVHTQERGHHRARSITAQPRGVVLTAATIPELVLIELMAGDAASVVDLAC
jgi:hypothetical protein